MKNKIFNFSLISLLSILVINPAMAENTEKVNYYLGESKMSSPEGVSYGSSLSLVKRTVSPDKNQIVEDVISIDSKNGAKEYITTFNLNKNNFTMNDSTNTFTGKGLLSGQNQNWNGWSYEANMTNSNGMITGEDKIINNEINSKKEFYQPAGKLRVIFNEILKPISKETFDILYINLMNKTK